MECLCDQSMHLVSFPMNNRDVSACFWFPNTEMWGSAIAAEPPFRHRFQVWLSHNSSEVACEHTR